MKLCMQITIHKKHKHISKYIKQKDKSQLVNLSRKCFEYYNTCMIQYNSVITHDESSASSQFHLTASKVMLVSTPL